MECTRPVVVAVVATVVAALGAVTAALAPGGPPAGSAIRQVATGPVVTVWAAGPSRHAAFRASNRAW